MIFYSSIFLVFFVAIVIVAIAMVTYLVSSTEEKKWIFYITYSAICLLVFLLFKNFSFDFNSLLFYWKQPFMIITYHSVLVLSFISLLVVPKSSIEKLKKNKFNISCIFFIFFILFIIY